MAKDTPKEEYSNLATPFDNIGYSMDFDRLYRLYFSNLLSIAMRLIIFEGLPNTIQETFFKYVLLINGKIVFFRLEEDILAGRQSEETPVHKGDIVALPGNKSDIQTLYYMNRKVLVTNPTFNRSYNLLPGKDCEIVYCTEPDKYKIFGKGGLFPLIARTATILADNDLSINCAQKNTRLHNVIAADDEPTKASAEAAIEDMYNGKPFTVAQSSLVANLTGIPMTQNTNTNNLVQLIEMRQYIYSHFYESLGLNAPHDNMKKERLISAEMNDDNEIAALNINDIISTIQEGLDRVNAMFGTSITAAVNPIVIKAQEDPDDTGEAAAAQDSEPGTLGADRSEDEAEQDEPADDQSEDVAEQDEPAADRSEEAAEQDEPAADQSEDEAEQDEPAADQSEDEAEQDEPATDQSEDEAEQDEPAEIQSEEDPAPVSVEVEAAEGAEVSIQIVQGGESDVQQRDTMV